MTANPQQHRRRRMIGTLAVAAAAAAGAGIAVAAPPAATDVAVSQSATPDPANVGRELTYSIAAVNRGPGIPKNLVVTDTLPAGAAFVRVAVSVGGSCSVPVVGTSGSVRCTWPDPPVGSTHTVAIVVKPTVVGTLVNVANAGPQGGQDTNAANDAATTTVRSIPFARAANGERCTWVGTAGNDIITGTPGKDVICGLGGNDTLNGLAGDDVLDGGTGNDVLSAGAGGDKLYGRAGADRLLAGAGNDLLIGGLGRDVLRGGLGRDRARVLVGDVVSGVEVRI